jgi:tRNA pseudouridine55 synthase
MQQEALSSELNFPEGYVLNVDKPLGWTSTDVVRKIKYTIEKLGYRGIKVGHAGTLDPLASGVLVVCIGKATKRAEELMCERKEYLAEVMLGASTVSHDLEHPVSELHPWEHITREAVGEALRELTGERLQTPPVYSAKRMEGKRAYEYAREGEKIEMRQALINIYNMELLECELPRIKIRVECSKGTYIRSLAHEIGEKLGSDGYLASLRRTQSGDFKAEEALELKKIIEILAGAKHF